MVNIKRLPLPLMDMYDWQYDGLCMDMDSDVFFSPEAERGAKRVRREDASQGAVPPLPCDRKLPPACAQRAGTVRRVGRTE